MDDTLHSTQAPSPRIWADQFFAMVEAGALASNRRWELRDGRPRALNPPHIPHMMAKGDVTRGLHDAIRAAGLDLRVDGEGSVLVAPHDVPVPDILVWLPIRQRGPVPLDRVRLIVEVADSSRADDLGDKRRLYAAAGVPEYWVVDLSARITHQFWAPSAGGYQNAATVPFGAPITAATLVGITVDTTPLG